MTNKTLRRYLTAAVSLLFIPVICNAGTVSDSTGIFKRFKTTRTKTALIKENRELTRLVDSLTAEIDRFRGELDQRDSLTAEILEIYEENEDKCGTGISPDEYTPEVTDSLLNIWYLHKKVSSDNN